MATLTDLAAHLRGLAGAGKPVVLDDAVVGASTAAALATAFALPPTQRLTLTGVAPADISGPTAGVLTVGPGTASVLKKTGVPITLAFTFTGGTLQTLVTAKMPGDWKFQHSFPALTMFPFDVLTVSNALFVYSTAAQSAFAWPGESAAVAVEPGLNLLCRLGFGGVSMAGALLGDLTGPRTWLAHGPFSPVTGEALPVGALSAAIGSSQGFSIGHQPYALALTDPRATVKIGTTDDLTPVQDVDLLIEGTFQQKLKVSVAVPVTGGAYRLSTAPLKPGDGSVASLLNSLPRPGGAPVTDHLPAELRAVFTEIGLDDFTLAVRTSPPRVTYAGISISTAPTAKWAIIQDVLELDGLRLAVETLDPSGLNWTTVRISANAGFLPRVFTRPFEFTAVLERRSSWQVASVSGAYPGSVSLGSLIGLAAGGADLPQELRDIKLTDISVTATRGATGQPFSYTVHGSVEAALPLHERTLTARLNLAVTKNGPDHTARLDGHVVVGEESFAFHIGFGTSGTYLDATWTKTGKALDFADIADAFGWTDLPTLPGDLDLALRSAGFRYDFGTGRLVLTALSEHYGQLVFASSKTSSGRVYLVDLDVPLNIALSDLPVAGPQIPASVDVGIKRLEVTYASAGFDEATLTALNTTLQSLNGNPISYPKLDPGLVLAAGLRLGGETRTLALPLHRPGAAPDPRAPLPPAVAQVEAIRSAGKSPKSANQAAFLAAKTEAIRNAGKSPTPTAQPAPTQPAPTQPASTRATPGPATPARALPPAPPQSNGGAWITVGRSFGPLHIERIGLQYSGGVLFFELDADVAFGPLALSLDGLGVGSALKKFEPKFHLDGLGVSYDAPPLQILGAILRVPDDRLAHGVKFQFDGELVVKSGTYGFGALGSYAQLSDGMPSLFVFVQLDAPLGGPPAFFVTGLMGGFGFNRELAVPGQDEVASFPLLLLSTQPPGGTGNGPQGPDAVLKVLEGDAELNGVKKKWITPKAGEYWLAAGLEFDTFKVVKSKALLAVDFGSELSVALLGLSTLRLPLAGEGPAKPFALVEMMIRVVVQPSQGVFAASAILTRNSYVLTPDCHLTGGFAFNLWWGDNPNAGQFVATLGGYHPAFKVPAHFPQVPRLGFNWAVSDTVSVKGETYFALTTSSAMAGGGLEALFHSGGLRAWFKAYADFLVSWHPFFYTGDIGVSIGVSLTIHPLFFTVTISLSLGASLRLWGPPTGGIVTVDLVLVSFSVRFGSDRAAAETQPLDWAGFSQLMPAHTDICGIAVTDGLFKTRDDPQSSSGKRWIVRAKRFTFQTRSAIPANVLAYDGKQMHRFSDGIAIKPMNRTKVPSTHSLTLYRDGSTTAHDVSHWSLEKLTQTLPASLWSAPPVPFTQTPARPSADVLDGELVGFTVTAPAPTPGTSRGPVAMKELREEYLSPAGQAPWSRAQGTSPHYLPTRDQGTVGLLRQASGDTVRGARTELFEVLARATATDGSVLFNGPNDPLTALAADAGHLFSDAPLRQT
ncbi:DUF6603 domain-containing protein [Streptomyces sp. NPDC088789]|uniref:DUF6603 domain-containing protein n=1 Tax=Streptomyces sp. NPDC088789 TaxID=3365899 RepID=UPI0037F68E11